MISLRGLAKAILPAPLRRLILAAIWAPRHRKHYFSSRAKSIFPTMVAHGEVFNFTYDLTDRNLRCLSDTISIATDLPVSTIELYIREAMEDRDLHAQFCRAMQENDQPDRPDLKSPFGRRLGWYAVARATKPKVIVETGVDKGHGALILCAALLRNAEEGFPGRYFGTDINPKAGYLLSGKYEAVGKILYGDSITSLKNLEETIDLFINDSDHSADYEAREYQMVAPKLSDQALILGDNAHVTDGLAVFSRQAGRQFLVFREEPKDHWYPGGGIGISFAKRRVDAVLLEK